MTKAEELKRIVKAAGPQGISCVDAAKAASMNRRYLHTVVKRLPQVKKKWEIEIKWKDGEPYGELSRRMLVWNEGSERSRNGHKNTKVTKKTKMSRRERLKRVVQAAGEEGIVVSEAMKKLDGEVPRAQIHSLSNRIPEIQRRKVHGKRGTKLIWKA